MTAEDFLSYELEGLCDRQAFLDTALYLLARLVPADAVAWNAVDEATRLVEVRAEPKEIYDDPEWAHRMSLVDDNPMVRSYLDPPIRTAWSAPRRMSDIISTRDLRNTAAYNEVFAPLEITYEITVLTARPTVRSGRAFALTRSDRDFTADELMTAVRVQPILADLDRMYAGSRGSPGPPRSRSSRTDSPGA